MHSLFVAIPTLAYAGGPSLSAPISLRQRPFTLHTLLSIALLSQPTSPFLADLTQVYACGPILSAQRWLPTSPCLADLTQAYAGGPFLSAQHRRLPISSFSLHQLTSLSLSHIRI